MPAKTEMPWYFSTMAWISSITSTVLPTPAPPNIAALPPWASGTSRSITLMPVSNTAPVPVCTASGGGWRWMGQRMMSAGKGGPWSRDIAHHVQQAAEHRIAHRHRDRPASGSNCCAATKTGGRLEGDGAHGRFVQMTLNLRRQVAWLIPGDFQRFLDLRQDSRLEGDVDYRPAQGDDPTRVWPTRV